MRLEPTAESTGALKPCRGCNWNRSVDGAYDDFSFILHSKRKWELRTTEGTTAKLNAAKRLRTKVQQAEQLKADGLYQLNYALQPNLFPHVRPFEGTPQDVMHAMFSSGTANSELAELLYILIAVEHDFSVNDLNCAIDSYAWPAGHKPPPVWPSIVKGSRDHCPEKGACMRYSGAQSLHFMEESISLLEPLIKNRKHPAWLSWRAHVQLMELLLAESFTPEAILAVDRAISKHQALYQAVPEYAGRMRPKHHFMRHLPIDISNFGPGAIFLGTFFVHDVEHRM